MGGRRACRRRDVGAEAAAQLLLLTLFRQAAPTFPGPSRAHGPPGTTLPGKSRARARARVPRHPPWRPYCPGRSSSRVSSRIVETTPPAAGLGRRGGDALRANALRAKVGPNPGGAAGSRRRTSAVLTAGVQAPPGGERGARQVGGRWRGASQGGTAGGARGRWPGAGWR